MKVYEVLIDWGGTTRSRCDSEGLFYTKDGAERYIKDIKKIHQIFGGTKIQEIVVRSY